MMMKIGLVLRGPMSYSLTFIVNEVKVWQELGFQVIVFAGDNRQQLLLTTPFTTIAALPLSRYNVKRIVQSIAGIFKVLVLGTIPMVRFLRYELHSGTTLLQTIKKIYKVAHILPEQLDVIHFGFGNVALGKEYLAKAMKAKMSISFRGSDIAILPLADPLLYKKAWDNADKIHVISRYLHQEVIRYGCTNENKIQLIYQTLDLEYIKAQPLVKGLSQPLQLITVARLHWTKGIEYALCTVKSLLLQGLNCHYTIIGSGEHEWAIRYAMKELELEDFVSLTGALPYDDVLKRVAVADIYVQSSVQEGFCNAVLEAQALGVLTVATDAGGIRENIEDGYSGWLVPKRNAEAMAEKIKKIIALSGEEKEKIKATAKERIRQTFYLNRYKEDWNRFFSE